jgi:CheY-like chemotaxis protein
MTVDEKNIENNKILIVDNSYVTRRVTREFLEQYGFICTDVESVDKAVFVLKYNLFDLILTDVMMPNIDGIEFCQVLKNNEKTKNIPVIMFSGERKKEMVVQAIRAGAVSFLLKPVNFYTLLNKINEVLEK